MGVRTRSREVEVVQLLVELKNEGESKLMSEERKEERKPEWERRCFRSRETW